MLRHNTSLKEVSLTSNPIGDAGADALTQALTVNTTLKDIRLDGVGHRGLDLIACHLPAMSGLTRITIFDLNGLTPQIVDSFIEALERNTELESVCLRAYNDPDAERLIEGIMPRVNHQMLLNHGGKRILSEHNFLNGLWPKNSRQIFQGTRCSLLLPSRETRLAHLRSCSRHVLEAKAVLVGFGYRVLWFDSPLHYLDT